MKKKQFTIVEDVVLAGLLSEAETRENWTPPYYEWIQIIRSYLRMNQTELAERSGIPQPYIVAIESGKKDVHISTLKKIFSALNCGTVVTPRPQKPLKELLRDRARAVALKRLKQSMGTMALEDQAPEGELFKQLLEKKTDEILSDRREKLWNKTDG